MELDYEVLRSTPVASDPFPHVVIPRFLPPGELDRVVRTLPEIDRGGSYPPESLRLAGGTRELFEELSGERFRGVVAGKFGLDLDGAPVMATLRGLTREKDGRIHRDSAAKRVTALLYLNPPADAWARHDGCLRLLRGPGDMEDYAVEVPPVDGTLLVFPNGPTTWHGHKPFVGRRYAIQLNYMTTGGQARSELRRHRVSAVFKRFAGSVQGACRGAASRGHDDRRVPESAGCGQRTGPRSTHTRSVSEG